MTSELKFHDHGKKGCVLRVRRFLVANRMYAMVQRWRIRIFGTPKMWLNFGANQLTSPGWFRAQHRLRDEKSTALQSFTARVMIVCRHRNHRATCHVQPIPAGSTVPSFWGLNLNRWFCLYRASTLDVQPQLKSPLFPALQEELVGGNPFFSSFSPLKWSGIGLSNAFYPLETQGSAAQRLERQRSKDTGCPTLQIDG